MKPVEFHPEAEEELQSSARYYESRLNGLGLRFLQAVERGGRERRVAEEYRTLERSEKAFHRFHDDLIHRHAKDPAARLASLADRVEQSGLDAVWAEYLADLIGDIGCDQPDLAPSAVSCLAL